jgi:hypothetical protein
MGVAATYSIERRGSSQANPASSNDLTHQPPIITSSQNTDYNQSYDLNYEPLTNNDSGQSYDLTHEPPINNALLKAAVYCVCYSSVAGISG